MTDARVSLWGRDIGAVSWINDRSIAVFQFAPDFVDSNIELSPIEMPLSPDPYEFPGLAKEAFKGLPGLLADSLPDKFGNALINRWLATQGRLQASIPLKGFAISVPAAWELSNFIQQSYPPHVNHKN